MSKNKRTGDGKVRYRIKQFLNDFSNYENDVTFICSLESWFEHRWGDAGQDV